MYSNGNVRGHKEEDNAAARTQGMWVYDVCSHCSLAISFFGKVKKKKKKRQSCDKPFRTSNKTQTLLTRK